MMADHVFPPVEYWVLDDGDGPLRVFRLRRPSPTRTHLEWYDVERGAWTPGPDSLMKRVYEGADDGRRIDAATAERVIASGDLPRSRSLEALRKETDPEALARYELAIVGVWADVPHPPGADGVLDALKDAGGWTD